MFGAVLRALARNYHLHLGMLEQGLSQEDLARLVHEGARLSRVFFPSFGEDDIFSPTAESFGVSAQIGSGVVRGGPEVRFHEGSTRVPPHAVGDITRYFFARANLKEIFVGERWRRLLAMTIPAAIGGLAEELQFQAGKS